MGSVSGFDASNREIATPAEVDAYKRLYAAAMLRNPDNVYEAALELFEGNTAQAFRAVNLWTFDPDVIRYKRELKDEMGEEAFLPTKGEFCKLLWSRMQYSDDDNFHKIADVYAKTRGFYPEKNGANVEEMNVVNKVMVIRDHGSDTSWSQGMLNQQALLQAANDE